MQSEHIALAALTFLHLAKTGEIFFVSKGPRVHKNGIPTPDVYRSPMKLLTPVTKALYDAVNK